jgi:hypothetical protein
MTDTSWLGPPIDVRPVLAEQQVAFIDLLRRLDAEEWAQPTICPGWSVKDVAATSGTKTPPIQRLAAPQGTVHRNDTGRGDAAVGHRSSGSTAQSRWHRR